MWVLSLLLHDSLSSVTVFGEQLCQMLSGDPSRSYQIDFSPIGLWGMASLYKYMLIFPQDIFIYLPTL